MSEGFSRAPVEQLPSVHPAEQLIPNGQVQFFEVAKRESRTGGESFLDMSMLSPLQSGESGFKVGDKPADLMAVIVAGEQRIGIIDTKAKEGYGTDYFMDPTRFIFANMTTKGPDASQMFEVATLPDGSLAAAVINEPDTVTLLGRDFQSRPLDRIGVGAASDKTLSGKHARFRLDEQGMLEVKDMKSRNGLNVVLRPKDDSDRTLTSDEANELYEMVYQKSHVAEGVGHIVADGIISVVPISQESTHEPRYFYDAEQPFKADKYAASQVDENEIVREEGNSGRAIDMDYKHNQTNARQYLVDRFDTLYLSKDNFKHHLKNAHKLAAAGDVYGKVGMGKMGLDETNHGVIREEAGNPVNARLGDARIAAAVASQYGDPYANRLFQGAPEGLSTNKVFLEGIADNFLPQDTVFYDEAGKIGKYEFVYPDGEGVDAYMGKIQSIGTEIAAEMSKTSPDKAKALRLIAKQYQYGAISRPFKQINNSLFMNLANMQIKMLGLKGITHGQMDIVAQRLQPESFTNYFVDRVEGRAA